MVAQKPKDERRRRPRRCRTAHFRDALRDPPHVDWLVTGSGFDRRCFEVLWSDVARFLVSEEAGTTASVKPARCGERAVYGDDAITPVSDVSQAGG